MMAKTSRQRIRIVVKYGDLVDEELSMWEHHQGKLNAHGNRGWLRVMFYRLTQQLIRQEVDYWRLYVALRPDRAHTLVSYPYFAKCTRGHILEYVAQYRRGLEEVYASRALNKRDYEEESESLEESTTALQREQVILKRQRKTLKEDLMEKPGTKQLEEAYMASVTERVKAVTAKQPKQKFHTKEFRSNIEKYYGAAEIRDDVRKVHCPLAGWWESEDVECTHIVRRTLSSEELFPLYGAIP